MLVKDAVPSLSPAAATAYDKMDLSHVLFADDTLVMGVNVNHLSELAEKIEAAGAEYGLQLHWGKVQLVQAGRITGLKPSNGIDVEAKSSMEYLGSLVHKDGWAVSGISRRVGMCAKLFRDLENDMCSTCWLLQGCFME